MEVDKRIQVCPIILEIGNRFHPDRFVPIYLRGHRYGHHLEEVQTVGDLLDSMKVEDHNNLDRDAFIIWKHQEKNVYCGGEVVMAFGVAKQQVHRFNNQESSVFSVYISLTDDGRLVTAIPG